MRRVWLVAVLVVVAGLGALSYALLNENAEKATPAADTAPRATSAACQDRVQAGRSGSAPRSTLACLRLPRRLVPPGADASARQIDDRTFLLTWVRGRVSGYSVWRRRDADWQRLFSRRRTGDQQPGVALEDVTQDARRDALVQRLEGSGLCGEREVLAIGATRVISLFDRPACEQISELKDGLLYYREPIAPCQTAIHCYNGVRITIRGWSGNRIAINRQIVRCARPNLDPRHNCKRT